MLQCIKSIQLFCCIYIIQLFCCNVNNEIYIFSYLFTKKRIMKKIHYPLMLGAFSIFCTKWCIFWCHQHLKNLDFMRFIYPTASTTPFAKLYLYKGSFAHFACICRLALTPYPYGFMSATDSLRSPCELTYRQAASTTPLTTLYSNKG